MSHERAEGAPLGRARFETPRLVYVTDTTTVPLEILEARLERVAREAPRLVPRTAVQLRDWGRSGRELSALARRLRAFTLALGVKLLVNDRVDLARLVGADGVHLGRASMRVADARALLGPTAFVSVACHGTGDVLAAAREGATACTLSPIFVSPGKGAPLGPSAIADVRRALGEASLEIGLVALGGLDDHTMPLALEAGADGIAAIRAEITPALLGT